MKNIKPLVLFLSLFTLKSQAINYDSLDYIKGYVTNPYLQINEIANEIEILPPPPKADSIEFKNDIIKYNEGKALRNTDRGLIAISDCELLNGSLQKSFSKAFGIEINQENTPKLYDILSILIIDAGELATFKIKKYYHRVRPYVYFNEGTCNNIDNQSLSNNGSYISGHATLGWAVALILAEINPKRQNKILKRGYEFGQSRVICGYHWQSDVVQASIVASALVAKLHTNPKFIQDLNQAKEEFENIKHLIKK